MKPLHVICTFSLIWAIHAQSIAFDSREATIDSVHHAIFIGKHSCREVVSAFIARIMEQNHIVNAVISLNPQALVDADALDTGLANGTVGGSLFCIPVLLKDNFDAEGLMTTGGSVALAHMKANVDAPSVAALRRAGAIILGKANLHELALEGLTVSSLGGQTINPYDSSRTPGGSSGGSGAAVAASFAVLATGSDTANSVRSPASANSLFGVRPTRGLISRSGVIPISFTNDALGPIARSVKDCAVALSVMASVGYDAEDNSTALVPVSSVGLDYSAALTPADLSKVRFGVLTNYFNRTSGPEQDPVNNAMDHFMAKLKARGAELVPIDDPALNITFISTRLHTQTSEFRESVNNYLSRPSLSGSYPRSFEELYSLNSTNGSNRFLVIPSQYQTIRKSLISWPNDDAWNLVQSGVRNLTVALHVAFKSQKLDAMIYPEQRNLVVKIGSSSQSGRNGLLSATTGSPAVTIPIGFSNASETAPLGVPIGMEIMGLPWTDQQILNIARAMELLGPVRKSPLWTQSMIAKRDFDVVPQVTPSTGNIPTNYPLGTF